jgi:hypothetical protein
VLQLDHLELMADLLQLIKLRVLIFVDAGADPVLFAFENRIFNTFVEVLGFS